ncbi:hypothetical protein H0X09_00340 [Candidatus Saccharibacteria bacterium]|nr:hypothetical protein [Candidatus Saccharibacteria bacterium]
MPSGGSARKVERHNPPAAHVLSNERAGRVALDLVTASKSDAQPSWAVVTPEHDCGVATAIGVPGYRVKAPSVAPYRKHYVLLANASLLGLHPDPHDCLTALDRLLDGQAVWFGGCGSAGGWCCSCGNQCQAGTHQTGHYDFSQYHDSPPR